MEMVNNDQIDDSNMESQTEMKKQDWNDPDVIFRYHLQVNFGVQLTKQVVDWNDESQWQKLKKKISAAQCDAMEEILRNDFVQKQQTDY